MSLVSLSELSVVAISFSLAYNGTVVKAVGSAQYSISSNVSYVLWLIDSTKKAAKTALVGAVL